MAGVAVTFPTRKSPAPGTSGSEAEETNRNQYLRDSEYLVLENYTPAKEG